MSSRAIFIGESYVGEVTPLEFVFRQRATNALTNPTSISLKIGRLNDAGDIDAGTLAEYTHASMTNESTGVYVYNWTPPSGGTWIGRVATTGTIITAYQFRVTVAADPFA